MTSEKRTKVIKSDAFVFFGASGDLAKKQIFPALSGLAESRVIDFPIIGSALDDWSDSDLRKRALDSLKATKQYKRASFAKLSPLLKYVQGNFEKDSAFKQLSNALADSKHPIFYMAVPPSMFESIAVDLAKHGCLRDGRLVVEKPFGADLASAQKLNNALRGILPDERIYRIDHYLGKESMENLAIFHQINPLLRAAWNNEFIDHIQITMAEKFGVSDRGKLYDAEGTIRDVVQNHLMQILANLLLAHSPKSLIESDAINRGKALALVSEAKLEDAVLGQFEGYTSVAGVQANSKTETFVALKLAITGGDLKGVPVFIRAGKRLPVTATQVHVVFKKALENLELATNSLCLSVTPTETFSVTWSAKKSGRGEILEQVTLDSGKINEVQMAPYVRLLGDAVCGDRALFSSEESVERSWEIVDPLLNRKRAPEKYAPGTWALSDKLLPPGGWRMS